MTSVAARFAVLMLLFMSACTAMAQGGAPTAKEMPGPAGARTISIDVLKGAWVRPDGGYVILIRNVAPNGQLEAMYFNPSPLPFSKAQAVQDAGTFRASFEIQAGGYSGSTYELTYDAASDQLKGVYYQAVMKQKFDVAFVRKK
jgi:hypothetical protein